MRILILGAGAHGQTIADVLLYLRETGSPLTPIGFVDDDPTLAGATLMGLPVLGPLAAVATIPHDALVVGIGRNAVRKRIYECCLAAGAQFVTVRHPTAVLAGNVVVGPGTYIGPTAVVSVGTCIGANCIVNGTSCLGHHNVVGDHAHIAPGVHTTGHVRIGEGAQIGVGASIIPGQHVGAWSIVGAGAVVTRPVADGVTVVGVPARPLRTNRPLAAVAQAERQDHPKVPQIRHESGEPAQVGG